MVDEVITKQELIDAKRDARDLGKAANEKVIVDPRYGADFKSIPLIVQEGEAKITQAAQTITSATASILTQKDQASQTITSATASVISQKNQAAQTISQAESDVVTAAADVHQRGNQEIINLQNAIDIAAAAGAGENGWTSLLVDHEGSTVSSILSDLQLKAKGVHYVTPEMYGTIGSAATDNSIFVLAIASGLPVLCMGAEYKLTNLVVNRDASIVFGKNTKVINTQTGGPKVPSITFAGQGLIGASVNVTGIKTEGSESSYHADAIYVSDATQFAVGDTVLLQENMPNREEVNYPSTPKLTQDMNYREFATISSIVDNKISFQEFLRFPYKVSNSLTLQKVGFLENANVSGGIYIGANSTGGGVKFSFCRRSSSENIKSRGLSDADRNGGAPVFFENCWESTSLNTDGFMTLYSHRSTNNQSCQFRNISGKRTSNGGVMSSGDRFCHVGPIVQDSPGLSNGDGLSVSNGSRHNTYGPFTISGARCYSLWLHQGSDDNLFLPFKSVAGITGGAYVFGDRNTFDHLDVKGHPSFGLAILGNDNYANVDIDVDGTGVSIQVGTAGNRVFGRSISRGTTSISRDLLIGNVTDTTVEILGGERGVGFAGATTAAALNYSNTIEITGKNPYSLKKVNINRGGYVWNTIISGVSATPVSILVPTTAELGDSNSLAPISATALDSGTCYKIALKTNSTIEDTYSEYLAFTRQGAWSITAIKQGASTYAPTLIASAGGTLEVVTGVASALVVFASIQRFG